MFDSDGDHYLVHDDPMRQEPSAEQRPSGVADAPLVLDEFDRFLEDSSDSLDSDGYNSWSFDISSNDAHSQSDFPSHWSPPRTAELDDRTMAAPNAATDKKQAAKADILPAAVLWAMVLVATEMMQLDPSLTLGRILYDTACKGRGSGKRGLAKGKLEAVLATLAKQQPATFTGVNRAVFKNADSPRAQCQKMTGHPTLTWCFDVTDADEHTWTRRPRNLSRMAGWAWMALHSCAGLAVQQLVDLLGLGEHVPERIFDLSGRDPTFFDKVYEQAVYADRPPKPGATRPATTARQGPAVHKLDPTASAQAGGGSDAETAGHELGFSLLGQFRPSTQREAQLFAALKRAQLDCTDARRRAAKAEQELADVRSRNRAFLKAGSTTQSPSSHANSVARCADDSTETDDGIMQLTSSAETASEAAKDHRVGACNIIVHDSDEGAETDTAGQGGRKRKRGGHGHCAIVPMVALCVFSSTPSMEDVVAQIAPAGARRELQEHTQVDDFPRSLARLVAGALISVVYIWCVYALRGDSADSSVRLRKVLTISSTVMPTAVGCVVGNALPVVWMLAYTREYYDTRALTFHVLRKHWSSDLVFLR